MSINGKTIRLLLTTAPQFVRLAAINKYFSAYGKMIDFSFNPKKKELFAKMLPAGEKSPISIRISDYDFLFQENKYHILIKKAHCDREWINVLINKLLIGKAIELPAEKARLLFEIFHP